MSTAPSFRRTGRDIIGKGGRKSFPGGRKSSLEIKGHRSSENTETQSEPAEQPVRRSQHSGNARQGGVHDKSLVFQEANTGKAMGEEQRGILFALGGSVVLTG